MFDQPPRYRTYLLTMWQERSRAPPQAGNWRFKLEDPRTGQKQAFATLEALMAALQTMLTEQAGDGEHRPGPEKRA